MRQIKTTNNELGFAEFLSTIHSRFQNGIKIAAWESDDVMRVRYDHILLSDDYMSIEFTYQKDTGHFFTYVLSEIDCTLYDDVATSKQEFIATLIELNMKFNQGDFE